MAREHDDGRPDASLDRRSLLRAAGALTAGLSLGVGATAAATDAPTVDVAAATTDHRWTTVPLSASHADPVVVAPTLSYRGRQPASPRVRNVSSDSFDVSVEEWRYLDGAHLTETIGAVATDAGTYALADGSAFEVGRVRTDQRWRSAAFDASFSTTPVVFSGAQTVNGPQPVVTRHRNRSTSGFDVRLQEEEAQGPHRTETVGYLAVEPGTGTIDGHPYEVGVASGVGGGWRTIAFADSYDRPVMLADVQTYAGRNACTVRYRNLTGTSVDVKVEEERSSDDETAHLGEQVGYLVVDESSAATATTTTTSGDTPLSELDRSRVERRIHVHVNERRADHGLAALSFDTDLREIARYHSEDMASRDYFSHTDPDGNDVSDRYDRFGYACRADTGNGTYYTSGENIAYTYYDTRVRTDGGIERYTNADELARGVVRGWMNSEHHRENILTPAWDDEGIGVAVTSEGKVYATQNFC